MEKRVSLLSTMEPGLQVAVLVPIQNERLSPRRTTPGMEEVGQRREQLPKDRKVTKSYCY